MSRALGLALGYVADRAVGDPRRFHPVAGFGHAAAGLERLLYDDSRARGIAHTTVLVATATGLGVLLQRRGGGGTLLTAVATWAVLGGRSLEREAEAVAALLSEDLPAARRRLTHLVGRATSALDEGEIARAVVESVAENTSDAVVAPLLAGALFGVPGLLGYRAVNTLDAMVGHQNARYAHFGWASARLDDLANLPGSRLAAALAVVLGNDPAGARRAWRRDAAGHPSPNAGPVEAAFAGALGVRLGGRNTYGDRVEHRAVLGDGRPADQSDIARATRLARRVGLGSLLVAAGLAAVTERRGGRGPGRPPRRAR